MTLQADRPPPAGYTEHDLVQPDPARVIDGLIRLSQQEGMDVGMIMHAIGRYVASLLERGYKLEISREMGLPIEDGGVKES